MDQNKIDITAIDILQGMIKTKEERGAAYGDKFDAVGDILRILFPDGINSDIVFSSQFHILLTILSKLVRFCNSGLEHTDSVHDIGVYSAIIEAILANENENE